MLERPQSHEYPDYQEHYVSLVPPEGELPAVFQQQTELLLDTFGGYSEEQGDYRYAPGKWSIKQLIGHMADTCQIMSYRLLVIARGDQTPLPGFDENVYVDATHFERFPLSQLIERYRLVREAAAALMSALQEEEWTRIGTVNDRPLSARGQACVLIGHDYHHLKVLEERYRISV
ncbi:DinB family protein [Paenibacillus donghaensis]|uniref:Squalene--hopene cyclase n=1 Tax=Paenibacillus donghaensis TaxID=414771 RepID=A0A2Z2K8V5_9BACL|nr:DinB family protein [Paenibacillus donghaensis]ASA23086.1 squalene--hopene cyclase [Paenibacillus donghaensis]